MSNVPKPNLATLRPSSLLLLVGQILYVAFTLLHTGGNANDHHAIFAIYANDDAWIGVHAGQFVGMSILLLGLVVLFRDLDGLRGATTRLGVAGISAAVVGFALYGVLQAVDGVALKHAVGALADSRDGERTARFAATESLRWLEWGTRSYHDFAFALALAICAAATARVMAWPIPALMVASGLAYCVQGWLVGAEGFTDEHSIAIVVGWILNIAWMGWATVIAFCSRA